MDPCLSPPLLSTVKVWRRLPPSSLLPPQIPSSPTLRGAGLIPLLSRNFRLFPLPSAFVTLKHDGWFTPSLPPLKSAQTLPALLFPRGPTASR